MKQLNNTCYSTFGMTEFDPIEGFLNNQNGTIMKSDSFEQFKKQAWNRLEELQVGGILMTGHTDPFSEEHIDLTIDILTWANYWNIPITLFSQQIKYPIESIPPGRFTLGVILDDTHDDVSGSGINLTLIHHLLIIKSKGFKNIMHIVLPNQCQTFMRCICIASEYTDTLFISPSDEWNFEENSFEEILYSIQQMIASGTLSHQKEIPKVHLDEKWFAGYSVPRDKIRMSVHGKENILTRCI